MITIILGLRFTDVVDDHPANGIKTMLLLHEILRIGRRNDLWNMFVLRNRKHFLFGEVTHANAVFE